MWQVGLATRIYDAQYGSGHKRGHMYVRRLARLSWMHRYILLYTTAGNIYNYTSNFNGQLDIPWEDKIDYCHFRVVQMAWWRHQMELFSALLALCAGNATVTGESHTQRPVARCFDVFICVWTNGCAKIRDAGDLRRHRAHYDVTVMCKKLHLNWYRGTRNDGVCTPVSGHGSRFRVTGHLWGESTGYRSPRRGSVKQSFGAFFFVKLGKLGNQQSICLWLEMLWRSCNVTVMYIKGKPEGANM